MTNTIAGVQTVASKILTSLDDEAQDALATHCMGTSMTTFGVVVSDIRAVRAGVAVADLRVRHLQFARRQGWVEGDWPTWAARGWSTYFAALVAHAQS